MKILITGGAGFIGSHTVDLCVAHGHSVTVIDDLSTGKLKNLEKVADRVDLIELDIRDSEALAASFSGMDVVLHLAAISSVEKSFLNPLETHTVNTSGTLNVLEAARINKVRRVVLASSAAVYGDEPTLPKTETSPVRPLSPYAWHKLTGEFYGSFYSSTYSIDFVSLRYFNVYGPRQDPDSPYSGVLSIFADRSLKKEPLTIYGDGGQTRDFVHVSDIAAVNLQAMLAPGPLPPIINIATGIETSIAGVARLIQDACGSEAAIGYEAARTGDIYRSFASNELMQNTFGYRQTVPVKEGIPSLFRE